MKTSVSPLPCAPWLNRWLATTCLVLALLLPMAVLYALLVSPMPFGVAPLGMPVPHLAGALAQGQMAPWQIGWMAVIALLPVGAISYGLMRARQCFAGFARGEVFSLNTVRHLRGFAAGLFFASLAGLLAPSLASALLAIGAPPNQRSLVISLGSQPLLMLLFAGMVWQIANVMMQAKEMADDHAQIV